MFKGPRGLLITLLGAAVIIVGAFYFGFQGQKDDAETSRAFMTHTAAGEIAEAHALFSPSLMEELSVQEWEEVTQGMEAYTSINFPSISFSNSNGQRSTELTGTGTTDSGCVSDLRFILLNGEISFFDIAPLCRGDASNT